MVQPQRERKRDMNMIVNLDLDYICIMIVTQCTRVYPNMGMSGNNYLAVCVYVQQGYAFWFHLFEVAVVRGWGGHETIKAI